MVNFNIYVRLGVMKLINENIKEDNELIDDYLSGDGEAFEKLLQKYLKPVYNFIFRLTNDRSAVDDLAQDTFIKAWRNIKRFKRDKNFKTWIFTIAKNTAYDYLKKKKNIPFSNFLDEEGNSVLDNLGDSEILPDELLAQAESAKLIEKKLNEIPINYRTILLLCYKEDFTFQEIAKILGKPYNTIKSQHQRALAKLKRILE